MRDIGWKEEDSMAWAVMDLSDVSRTDWRGKRRWVLQLIVGVIGFEGIFEVLT